jgi:hypothetical protein
MLFYHHETTVHLTYCHRYTFCTHCTVERGIKYQTYKYAKSSPDVYITVKQGDFCIFISMYCIQHCFICHPSDSTVSEDAGIEPRTVATLAVRRSNY